MQRRLVKFIIFILLLGCSSEVYACNFERDLIDKNAANLRAKFRISSEFKNNKFYQDFARVSDIKCDEIPSQNVELSFIDNKLAQMIFKHNTGEDSAELLSYTEQKFGRLFHPLNNKSNNQKNYADYRDNSKIIVSYNKVKLSENSFRETLVITSKSLAEDLNKNLKEVEIE